MNTPRYPRPLDDDVAQWADTLDEGNREWFEERSAIIEFDSIGICRRDAERMAMTEIKARLLRDATTPSPPASVPPSRK